jgi:hypothetical protein
MQSVFDHGLGVAGDAAGEWFVDDAAGSAADTAAAKPTPTRPLTTSPSNCEQST